MNSYAHVDNKGKDILILGEGPTQELNDTTLTAKAKYPINFTQLEKRFVLSLNIMEATASYSLMLQKYINSKQDSEIKDYALCLGNISKDFTINNMKLKE